MKQFIIVTIFFSMCSPLFAKDFESWKKNYIKKAATKGIPKSFATRIFNKVNYLPEVIEKDRNQIILSSKTSYQEFIQRWLRDNNNRIKIGQQLLQENDALLSQIEKKYGVDKEVIVSLWGVETFYGKITGDFNVIEALASLTYDGRRREFYETQLNAALRLIYKSHVSFENFKGSWAGATGQCQFMPSNIPVYGQDFDNDGKVDIWNSKADIFASIAYFLKKVGWKKGASIGSLAIKTKDVEFDLDKYRSQKQYNKLGVRTIDGRHISSENWKKRKAVEIPLKDSPIVLRGSNFQPLLRWNRSSLFAAFNIILVNSFKEDV